MCVSHSLSLSFCLFVCAWCTLQKKKLSIKKRWHCHLNVGFHCVFACKYCRYANETVEDGIIAERISWFYIYCVEKEEKIESVKCSAWYQISYRVITLQSIHLMDKNNLVRIVHVFPLFLLLHRRLFGIFAFCALIVHILSDNETTKQQQIA